MHLADFLDKRSFGQANILDSLPRHRIGKKADEIAWMTVGKCDTDLAVMLHPADPRSLARARVEDNKGMPLRVDLNVGRRQNPDEPVIDRPWKIAPVHDELEPEAKNVGDLFGGAFEEIVAALAQYVEEQHGALPGVRPVIKCLLRKLHTRPHRPFGSGGLRSGRHCVAPRDRIRHAYLHWAQHASGFGCELGEGNCSSIAS